MSKIKFVFKGINGMQKTNSVIYEQGRYCTHLQSFSYDVKN